MAYPDRFSAVLDQHRFYEFLNTTSLFTAVLYQGLVHRPADLELQASLACKVYDKEILIPIYNLVRIAVNYGEPAILDFTVIDTPPPVEGEGSWTTQGFHALGWSVIKGQFVMSVDPWLDWQKSKSSNYHSWPPVLNFCRVIRNAIAHGGKINIDSPNAPTVKWEGLTYGHAQNKWAISNDIGQGDMIALLFALDDELTQIGAPATPS